MDLESKKGGRPAKSFENKKSVKIQVKVTKSEAAAIQEKAKSMSLSVSEYCSVALKNSKIIAPFTEQELDLKRGLVGMGNNLNQIAYKANAAGIETVEQSAKELLIEIKKELEKFR